jgi:hypothetical protein
MKMEPNYKKKTPKNGTIPTPDKTGGEVWLEIVLGWLEGL